MGLFDKFRKPKYQHKKKEVRLEAVNELNDPNILEDIAKNDESNEVRGAAAEKITNEKFLMNLIKNEKVPYVIGCSLKNVHDVDFLENIALSNENVGVCIDAIENIHEDSILENILLKRSDERQIIEKTIEKINNINLIEKIASNNPNHLARFKAIDRVENNDILMEIALNDNEKYVQDKALSKITNNETLLKITNSSPIEWITSKAINKITDKEMLLNIRENTNNLEITRIISEKLGDNYLSGKINNFKYLDELIHTGDKVVYLKGHIKNNESEYETGITIDIDDMVIDGSDYTIDGEKSGRIFNILANNVTLKNITFTNAKIEKQNGGAIVNHGKGLKIENCIFKNNEAESGGAISNEKNGSINITDAKFIKCTSDLIGLPTSYGGGAILNHGEATLISSKFVENHNSNYSSLKGEGSAISNYGNLKLSNCIFDHNNSSNELGAFYNNGTAFVENCAFRKNHSSENGGAIYNKKSININNTIFTDNRGLENGGAIYNLGMINLKDCEFEANYSNHDGSTIYNKDYIFASDCIFKDNNCEDGSLIWNDNHLEIANSKIDNEKSIHLIYQSDGEDNVLTIENTEINSKLQNDMIHIENGFCSIINSKFTIENSKYILYNDKGIINISNSGFEDENNTRFHNNNILKIKNKTSNKSDGLNKFGFDYLSNLIYSGSEEIIIDCDIIMDEIEQEFYEGGIELNHDQLTIDGQNHIIDANGLSRIFHITGINITLKNIIFKNGKYFKNYYDNDKRGGGAIYALPRTNLEMINCKFIKNTSRVSSGAINLHGRGVIKDCKFHENSCEKNGGAICSFENLKIMTSSFNNNSSKSDGGCIYSKNNLNILDSNFTGNSSESNGGAIYGKNSLNLENINFKDNTSKLKGGAVSIKPDSLKISNSNFNSNKSQRYGGGAIYIESSDIKEDRGIENCNFNNNASEEFGGAIINHNNIKIVGCEFITNIAQKNGGAISNFFKINLEKCLLKENTAISGGAIFNGRAHMELKYSRLLENSATASIIDNYQTTFYIEKCGIAKNKSGISLISDFYESKDITKPNSKLSDCKIMNNTTKGKGIIELGGKNNVSIKSSMFKNNQSKESFHGLYIEDIYNESIILDIENCIFEGEKSRMIPKHTIFNGNQTTIRYCTFKNKKIKNNGTVIIPKEDQRKLGKIIEDGEIKII